MGIILDRDTITARQLDEAIPFDIYRHVSREKNFTEVVDRIERQLPQRRLSRRRRSRRRDALRQVILNLIIGYAIGKPIKFHRRKARYRGGTRYRKLWFSYGILIPLIDDLEVLGYLEQKKGYYDHKKQKGRITRMWATQQLIALFAGRRPRHILKEQPAEIIQLKDESKNLIPYKDTSRIVRMRNRLAHYNNFISRQEITLLIIREFVEITFLITLINKLYRGECSFLKSSQGVKETQDAYRNYYYITNYLSEYLITLTPEISSNFRQYNNTIFTQYETLETQYLPSIPEISSVVITYNYDIEAYRIYSKSDIYTILPLLVPYWTFPLYLPEINLSKEVLFITKTWRESIYVEELVVRLDYVFLHRVFNKGSFSLGGRFYGAIYQQFPSKYRRYIYINGNHTVELDYSAFHIRMLYHLDGLECHGDPYSGIGDRKKVKLAQLIMINADKHRKGIKGIRKAWLKNGIYTGLKDEDIEALVAKFKAHHPAIAHHLLTGIGRQLQNIDSNIMDDILTNLRKQGIPALPVHDSVIVEKQYEEELYRQMFDYYKKYMSGFEPVVD